MMDLLKTSIRIGKTIRNVSRLREIVMIFAKNGFSDFISLRGVKKIPNFVLPRTTKSIEEEVEEREDRDWNQVVGVRLRKSFVELGPAFIKFGQLLSTREDIFDPAFIDEMKKLRDKVPPVPFSEIKKTIEQELGAPVEDIFEEIEPEPIGTASIGVVFKGTLKNGNSVVIKVRRPGIEKMIEVDFSIMKMLMLQAEKISEDIKFLGISRIVDGFAMSLRPEINFHIEALNCQRFGKVLQNYDLGKIYVIPKVYDQYTRENILVMEFLDGIPFTNGKYILDRIEEVKPKLGMGVSVFMKTFLSEGFFHADLHGGNFFLMKDNRIGLVDFGLMGRLSKKGRQSFVAIIYSLLTFNYENLVYEFLDVSEYEKIPDVDKIILETKEVLNPYIGLTTRQINYDFLLQNIFKILRNHRIYLPREWFIVFRAMTTLDGVNRSLGLDFDLYSIMEKDITEIIKDNVNKDEIIEEGIWLAKDLLGTARSMPRHLKWFIREWVKKGYAFDLNIKGHEKHLDGISNSVMFLSHALLTSIFVISGTLLIPDVEISKFGDVPPLCWIFWITGLTILLRGFWIQR